MTDATPVPCGMSRETVKRSDLAGHAGYGYCASHSRFYWGFKLYLVCAGDGMPIMWCLANPKLGEREVVAALLEHNHHLIRTGVFTRVAQRLLALAASICTHRAGAPDRPADQMEDTHPRGQAQLGPDQPVTPAHDSHWHNWTTGVTRKRSLTAYDH